MRTCPGLAAEIVTADGQILYVDAESHPDLFWALRGSGRGFGVVTAFQYRLHPLGPEVLAATVFYPMDQATHVLPAWRDFAGPLRYPTWWVSDMRADAAEPATA